MRKTYSDVISIKEFSDRLAYLSLKGRVSDITFGSYRYLNQMLYHSSEWKEVRRKAIIRDDCCDLAHVDYPILVLRHMPKRSNLCFVHHITPITIEDVMNQNPIIFDLENLITVSKKTHDIIHYGGEIANQDKKFVERSAGDTCLWR